MMQSTFTDPEDPAGAAAPPVPPRPPPTSRREHNFFQDPGLAICFVRVCLYLIFAFGVTYGVQWAARIFFTTERSAHNPAVLMTAELSSLIGVFASAGCMSLLEKRSFGAYGLPSRGAFGKLFWQGVLFGLAEISAVIGSMGALGAYHFGSIAVHGASLVRWAVFWALFFLVVGFYEEFSLRGYVQFTLAQGMKFWPAAILLSIIFGALHLGNPGENWVGIAGIVFTGLFWCLTLRRTGNLWFAVGMHASFDFGETFLYSVPDSGVIFPGHLSNATFGGPAWITGGTAGPEASVFDFLAIAILIYVFHHLHPTHRASRPIEDLPS